MPCSPAGTITVLHPPGRIGPINYPVLRDDPRRPRNPEAADATTVGMIAAGDRTPDPARAARVRRPRQAGPQPPHGTGRSRRPSTRSDARSSMGDDSRPPPPSRTLGSAPATRDAGPRGGPVTPPAFDPALFGGQPSTPPSRWWCAGTDYPPTATPAPSPTSPTGSAGSAAPTGSRPPSSHPAGSPTPACARTSATCGPGGYSPAIPTPASA